MAEKGPARPAQVNPSTDGPALHALLSASWALDPTTTLRLIFQMGNCRRDGGGKLDRLNFMRGLLWMWRSGHRGAVLGCLEEIPRQVPPYPPNDRAACA